VGGLAAGAGGGPGAVSSRSERHEQHQADRRARRSAARSRRRTFVSLALGVLLLVVLVGAIVLTQLDFGEHTPSERRADPSSTTTTTKPPPTTTTTRPRAHDYVVQSGDTLSGLAARFGVTTGAIVLTNHLETPDRLTVGQRLVIPPRVPVKLSIRPDVIAIGGDVRLSLSGAKAGERVTFRIDSPAGAFTGPGHLASPTGTVVTSYTPSPGDPAGTYTVTARGDQGTLAQSTFTVRT